MIRLTDEEIKKKWLGAYEEQELTNEDYDLDYLSDNLYYEDIYALRAVAKAQVKKVVEYITDTMHDADFSCVVYFHPGKEQRDWKGRWVVGNLTGIDNDLICVRRCANRGDEKRYLSPEGDNIIDALDKAVALLER